MGESGKEGEGRGGALKVLMVGEDYKSWSR